MRAAVPTEQSAFPVRAAVPGRRERGLTLIETMLAIVIIGVAVLALVSAQAAFHKKNFWASHASTATYLANEIRELTWNLPQRDPVTGDLNWGPEIENEISVDDFDDLDDFDGPPPGTPLPAPSNGMVFLADNDDLTPDSGPINARREVIPNMNGWSQTVRVFNVDPQNITFNPDTLAGVLPDGDSEVMGVQVIVEYQGVNDLTPTRMTSVSWIAPR